MDIRTQPSPPSTYVETTIPKVADTPLEGTESVESKTYGPFESSDSALDKAANKKARFVRFLEPGEDPIEKAFDSIFLFIDDVREAGSTGRGICSGDRIDTEVAPREDVAPATREYEAREDEYARQDIIVVDDEESDGLPDDGSEPGCMTMVTQRIVSARPTVECVTEGLCRNPCVDANMPPPVDLMLSVEETPSTQGENGAQPKPRSGRKVEFSFSKENSMRDVSLLEDDDEPEESLLEAVKNSSDIQAVFELFVERVRELVPKVLPQECQDDADEVLRQFSDTFVVEAVVATKEASTIMVKDGVDEDPIVEAIDRLILFFDDIQPHIADLQHRQQTYLEQLEPYYNELQPYFVELQQNIDDLQSLFTQQRDDLLKQFAALTGATESKKVANEVLQETVKPKKKTKALQMDPQEYAEALESAASLLSQYAPEEDLKKYSPEELHRRAIERIMAERPESEDDIPEYKSESMLLAELMHGADQAIMDSRNDEKDQDTPEKEPVRASHKEEVIVLGHSRSTTLTPIPEADEASAGTPTSEKIEEGVANGTIPEVPIFDPHPTEKEHELSPREERQEPEPEERMAVNSEVSFQDMTERMQMPEEPETQDFKQKKEYVENDPIVLVIDKMFLCYDDVQEEIHSDKPCNTCFGSSVPSDLADSVDDIIDRSEEAKEDDIIENETPAVSIDPRPETLGKSESSEGQYMLEQALLMVQEASKLAAAESNSFTSPDEVRIAKSSEEQPSTVDAEQPPVEYEADLVIDMMDRLVLAFEDAKEKAESLQLDKK